MVFDPNIHHRKSIRLRGYDYTEPGSYFITLVSWKRELFFGEIIDGLMHTSIEGQIVLDEWMKTSQIRQNVLIDEYILMPNHFHGILNITDQSNVRSIQQNDIGSMSHADTGLVGQTVGAMRRIAPTKLPKGAESGSIGAIIGQIKSITTKKIHKQWENSAIPVWQRNYYEHIISSMEELNQIRHYIQTNPLHWSDDTENNRK